MTGGEALSRTLTGLLGPLVPALLATFVALELLGSPSRIIRTVSGPIVQGPDGQWSAPYSGNFPEAPTGADPLVLLAVFVVAYAIGVLVLRLRRN
jgi:hypothetical protein